MIKVLINGCNGRMGKIVSDLVKKDEDMFLNCGIDKINSEYSEYKVYSNVDKIIEEVDVIIDFSAPESTMKILEYAKKYNIPIVICTTGFNEKEENKIKEYSKFIPIFKSANMSFEINILKNMIKTLAPKLKNSDIEIIETHHSNKVDSPSGTANMFADTINEALGGGYTKVYDRHSKREKRKKNEIGMTSIRGGNVVGEHTIMFFGESETFEIKHTTYSRNIFAEGAIKAAKFIYNKPNGFYSMDDLTD